MGFTMQLPLYLVLGFGAFLFIQLIYGVLTFRTVPEEYESLQRVRQLLAFGRFCLVDREGGRSSRNMLFRSQHACC